MTIFSSKFDVWRHPNLNKNPEINLLHQLINLELSINFLIGSIPSEISNLTNLWQLELYGNQLTGKIPTGFRNLTKLQRFDASNNSLEGDLSELKFMNQLVWIQESGKFISI